MTASEMYGASHLQWGREDWSWMTCSEVTAISDGSVLPEGGKGGQDGCCMRKSGGNSGRLHGAGSR
eukprot:5686127-Pyramimonas_sp.AAC.1